MINIRGTVMGVISIVLGVLFLIIGGGIADITTAVTGGVVDQVKDATNSTVTTNLLASATDSASNVFNILGVVLLAIGGIFIISILLDAFTEVQGKFKLE